MKDIYVEVLKSPEYSVVVLGKLGGEKVSLRSYSDEEAAFNAMKFATVISELLDCPLVHTAIS